MEQHDRVFAPDVIQSKVDLINSGKSPIIHKEIEDYLATKKLDLTRLFGFAVNKNKLRGIIKWFALMWSIEPTYPSERYGYIIRESADTVNSVKEFTELKQLKVEA